MPELTLYNFWMPDSNPPTLLIKGDIEILTLFRENFSDLNVSAAWTPKGKNQHMYDYGFYVRGATEADRDRFGHWLKQFVVLRPFSLENKALDSGHALSYHGEPISSLVRKAKPYGDEKATTQTKEVASGLARLMAVCLKKYSFLGKIDYFVAIPSRNKPFDLPRHLTQHLCQEMDILDGSIYVNQIRDKEHSQKDLESIEEKRRNVKDIFNTEANHPFTGKMVAIVDDIYRSGVTIEELVKVLRKANAKQVHAIVLTKTIRD